MQVGHKQHDGGVGVEARDKSTGEPEQHVSQRFQALVPWDGIVGIYWVF